jgi:hypothetical protein
MIIEQPLALKLAEMIDAFDELDESLPLEMLNLISIELRRLHEVNETLKADAAFDAARDAALLDDLII